MRKLRCKSSLLVTSLAWLRACFRLSTFCSGVPEQTSCSGTTCRDMSSIDSFSCASSSVHRSSERLAPAPNTADSSMWTIWILHDTYKSQKDIDRRHTAQPQGCKSRKAAAAPFLAVALSSPVCRSGTASEQAPLSMVLQIRQQPRGPHVLAHRIPLELCSTWRVRPQ